MADRMWNPAIALAEFLHGRPESSDHLREFFDILHSTFKKLLYLSTGLDGIWLENLGHLARYRSTISLDDDEEQYLLILAKNFYSDASQTAPDVGRHHNNMARHQITSGLQSFFYYM